MFSLQSHPPACLPLSTLFPLGTVCGRRERGLEAELPQPSCPCAASGLSQEHAPRPSARLTLLCKYPEEGWHSQHSRDSHSKTLALGRSSLAFDVSDVDISLKDSALTLTLTLTLFMHTHSIPYLLFAGLHFLKTLPVFSSHFDLHSFDRSVTPTDRLARRAQHSSGSFGSVLTNT